MTMITSAILRKIAEEHKTNGGLCIYGVAISKLDGSVRHLKQGDYALREETLGNVELFERCPICGADHPPVGVPVSLCSDCGKIGKFKLYHERPTCDDCLRDIKDQFNYDEQEGERQEREHAEEQD